MIWLVDLTCPECGHDLLEPVNTSATGTARRTAVMRCCQCRRESALQVSYAPVDGCGTVRGRLAHQRRGEDVCQACKKAHAADMAARRHQSAGLKISR